MSTDLAIIELTLRPRKFNRIPAWQGRAAQALLYSGLRRVHWMVSETIHDLYKWHPRMPKPFTMSTLYGVEQHNDLIVLNPDQDAFLRLTTFHHQLTSVVLQGVIPAWQSSGFSIHDQPLWIRHTHKHLSSYATLLDVMPDRERYTLHFQSPTAFKQTGKGFLAKPDPHYIFNSLFNRWNALTDFPFSKTIITHIVANIRVLDSSIGKQTLRFARGRKGEVTGFYGTQIMTLESSSKELKQAMHSLLLFARFSGVGVKTTVGMGRMALRD